MKARHMCIELERHYRKLKFVTFGNNTSTRQPKHPVCYSCVEQSLHQLPATK
jgi:hypothetical protein